MDEAFNYANDLRRLLPEIADMNFECIAIGGHYPNGARPNGFKRSFNDGSGTITVNAVLWDDLLQRAQNIPARHRRPLTKIIYSMDRGPEPVYQARRGARSTSATDYGR